MFKIDYKIDNKTSIQFRINNQTIKKKNALTTTTAGDNSSTQHKHRTATADRYITPKKKAHESEPPQPPQL